MGDKHFAYGSLRSFMIGSPLRTMSVTIKDVAKAAGVSHATVSRALRGMTNVSAETRRRIEQAASDLGYIPNLAASNLKTQRSNTIGVIAHRVDDPFFSRVFDGIEAVTRQQGYTLLLASTHHDSVRDGEIVATFAERRVDGVIVSSKRFEVERRAALQRLSIPVILINDQSPMRPSHAVSHDDYWGSQQLSEHLLALGHRRFAYLGNADAGSTDANRLLGLRAALAQADVSLDERCVIHAANGELDGGLDAAQRLLTLPIEPPTAIVAFNDLMAIGAMRALEVAGLRVPTDCSVTGFDGIDLGEYVTPRLTTLCQPMSEMGQTSADILLTLIDSQAATPPSNVVLRGKLIVRESTATPPTAS